MMMFVELLYSTISRINSSHSSGPIHMMHVVLCETKQQKNGQENRLKSSVKRQKGLVCLTDTRKEWRIMKQISFVTMLGRV